MLSAKRSTICYILIASLSVVNLLIFRFDFSVDVFSEIKNVTLNNHTNIDTLSSTSARTIRYYPFKEDNCALLFFGVPKCFNQTISSIKKYVVNINPTCHIYVHTYNISTLPANSRNKEPETEVNVSVVHELTNNVTMDTLDEFYKLRDLDYYRKHFPTVGGWAYPTSMDNMIKQWHSIESVWTYMESKSKSFYKPSNYSSYYYNHIGLFRLDQIYLNPINISNGIAVKGSFPGNYDIPETFNDRLFYGLHNTTKIWAAERFSYVPKYVNTTIGKERGLHSESFLYSLIDNTISVSQVETEHICAKRVRNDCTKHHECANFKL